VGAEERHFKFLSYFAVNAFAAAWLARCGCTTGMKLIIGPFFWLGPTSKANGHGEGLTKDFTMDTDERLEIKPKTDL
jgi:hypothetical protein